MQISEGAADSADGPAIDENQKISLAGVGYIIDNSASPEQKHIKTAHEGKVELSAAQSTAS